MHKLERTTPAPDCLAQHDSTTQTWDNLAAECKANVRAALTQMQGPPASVTAKTGESRVRCATAKVPCTLATDTSNTFAARVRSIFRSSPLHGRICFCPATALSTAAITRIGEQHPPMILHDSSNPMKTTRSSFCTFTHPVKFAPAPV